MQENLTPLQLMEFAKNNNSASIKFAAKKDGVYDLSGEILDTRNELVAIPCLGNRFMPLAKLTEFIGGNVTFDIIPLHIYRENVMNDYLKCGHDIPEKSMESPY